MSFKLLLANCVVSHVREGPGLIFGPSGSATSSVWKSCLKKIIYLAQLHPESIQPRSRSGFQAPSQQRKISTIDLQEARSSTTPQNRHANRVLQCQKQSQVQTSYQGGPPPWDNVCFRSSHLFLQKKIRKQAWSLANWLQLAVGRPLVTRRETHLVRTTSPASILATSKEGSQNRPHLATPPEKVCFTIKNR